MIGLLIITHETLGDSYLNLVQHFFPEKSTENLKLIQVKSDDDHESVLVRIQQILPEKGFCDGLLVLTDIFGATPCNAAMKLNNGGKTALLTGLNAPMLIKAVSGADRAENLNEFAQNVKNCAQEGIMLFADGVQTANESL